MQTFLPYDDFQLSAQVLDNKRLGKQRVEVLQILIALIEETGWIHHPATKMWKGYENMLIVYGRAICEEWINRGKTDNTLSQINAFYSPHAHLVLPPWFGREEFHQSHRSNLLRKDFAFYSKHFDDPVDLPYCWPKKIGESWFLKFKHAGQPSYLSKSIKL